MRLLMRVKISLRRVGMLREHLQEHMLQLRTVGDVPEDLATQVLIFSSRMPYPPKDRDYGSSIVKGDNRHTRLATFRVFFWARVLSHNEFLTRRNLILISPLKSSLQVYNLA